MTPLLSNAGLWLNVTLLHFLGIHCYCSGVCVVCLFKVLTLCMWRRVVNLLSSSVEAAAEVTLSGAEFMQEFSWSKRLSGVFVTCISHIPVRTHARARAHRHTSLYFYLCEVFHALNTLKLWRPAKNLTLLEEGFRYSVRSTLRSKNSFSM